LNHEYDCAQCGLCCTQYGGGLYLYQEDLQRWREEHETQVLRRLRVINDTATAWHAPETGEKEQACPFLTNDEGYRCAIYPTRPLVCRHFANGGSACRELRARQGLPVADGL
jgi:Fe-S-cluster containining protein